jgi:CBS domain-containing protein
VFGSPLSAVILAVELLLFELRPRSLVPVALATVAATGVRHALVGSAPVFPMPLVAEPGMAALACYVLLGALVGLASVGATRIVYGIEDLFEKLPLHWMWWPAIGGLVVGLVGWIEPRTLGVGYDNIEAIVAGHFGAGMLLSLALLKFASWSVALGSGTSGGTLAPLFTIGGALGALAGIGLVAVAPQLGIDPRIAGLVGMAAIFAGASRALLASIVFAFETTRQPAGLLPLLGGCVAAYLVSALVMRNTIMTEKIARRGVRVPSEYGADYLEQIGAGTACTRDVVTLREDDRLGDIRHWLASGKPEAQHQGYPVLGGDGRVLGVLTRRDLLDMRLPEMHRVGSLLRRPPIVVGEQHSLREAADHMVAENVGRLVVVAADAPNRMVGILTRGDLLAAHARRLREKNDAGRHLRLRGTRRPRGP